MKPTNFLFPFLVATVMWKLVQDFQLVMEPVFGVLAGNAPW